ncbi:MAG: transposase [Candidatus Aenigmarchaeota archaeon]|nr:transposase [Candidatus Aenigmarchaeota archaeon]
MQTIENQNNTRMIRGQEIANTSRIMKREKGGYIVPSQSGGGAYLVTYENYKPQCECKDFELKGVLGIKCKHIWSVEITLNKKLYPDGTIEVTQTVRKTYAQDWSAYTEAQTNEKSLFLELLNDLCNTIDNPVHDGRGRKPKNMSDMIFCSALKVYTTFSLRRFISDMKTAKEKNYINSLADYSTVALYMENADLTPMLVDLILKSARPLKAVETEFAIDSSGFGTSRFSRWFSFKYGKEVNSRIWVKAHLMCGVKTNVVTGVKITEAYSHDTKEFPELLETTAKTFEIKEVSADKAYSSRDNLELVDSLGGTAFIPFKSNTTGKAKGSLLWKKLYNYYTFNREEFLQHYHKRSNIESTNNMVKVKFGDYVRSKTWTAQVNEVLLKILCHNICVVIQEMYELGIEPNFMLKN